MTLLELLAQFQTTAADRKGPRTKVTADGKWIEQRLIDGLSAAVLFQGVAHVRKGLNHRDLDDAENMPSSGKGN